MASFRSSTVPEVARDGEGAVESVHAAIVPEGSNGFKNLNGTGNSHVCRGPSHVPDTTNVSSSPERSIVNGKTEEDEERLQRMCGAVRTLLECLGEDPSRDGLRATPLRYARALLDLTEGYRLKPESVVNDALFNEGHREMVIVRDIEMSSLCEHHILPFNGKVSTHVQALATVED